ncbi:MAG TPA: hypothetical protein VHW09_14430 [Bryobacteraceae bacterium]|jgi:hypothetical protein|nr:hypothetical protein [Bryobacteraceae bacterium]
MTSPTLATLGSDLQKAAGRRAYADVQVLAVRIGEAAAAEVRSLPAGDAGIREMAAWLADLFRRTEILLRIARASQAAELRRVTFLRRYLLPQQDRRAARVKLSL